MPINVARSPPLNSNVRLALLFALLISVANTLVSSTPLAAFMLIITQNTSGVPRLPDDGPADNFAVGVATGVQGLVNLLCAIPAGVLADRIGRQAMLRLAAVVGIISAAVWGVCLLYVRRHYSHTTLFYSLLGAAAVFGTFFGLHAAPLEALFGDSIESGSRSKLYAIRQSIRTAGGAVGPAVSIVVFLTLGDTWREPELVVVMLVGVGTLLLPALTLLFFRDKATLGG